MDPVEAGSSSGIWKGVDGQWNRLPPNGYLGMDPERYCVTCNIWRPPRASHCSICGFCFEVRLTGSTHLLGDRSTLVDVGQHCLRVCTPRCAAKIIRAHGGTAHQCDARLSRTTR
jgi:hypothetical protein